MNREQRDNLKSDRDREGEREKKKRERCPWKQKLG